MFVYWALFLVPAMASAVPARLDSQSRRIMLFVAGLALSAIIGLRYEVGRDWNNYVSVFDRVVAEPFWALFLQEEPAYGLLAWTSERLGLGIYGANFACAAVLVYGLMSFCWRQPSPWRTLAFAMPVLVIGIGMSGMRQATAIGFLMLAMNAFTDGRLRGFIFWVLLAVPFHQTAAAFLPLAWFMRSRIALLPVIVAGGIFVLLGIFVLKDSVNYYTESYLKQSPEANGALPRVALNVLAAVTFLVFRKEWTRRYSEGTLFTLLAFAAVPMAAAVFMAPVAADRMSMYLIPFQIAVFSRLPEFVRTPAMKFATATAILVLYALTLGIWLSFSKVAQSNWLPYQSILWG